MVEVVDPPELSFVFPSFGFLHRRVCEIKTHEFMARRLLYSPLPMKRGLLLAVREHHRIPTFC